MAGPAAFDDAVFLGLARRSKRDPYRLGLLARHLDPGEQVRILLAIQGGTLVVTDRRLLEFRAHLEVHGAWNVKEFQGYEVRREMMRAAVEQIEHTVAAGAEGRAVVEDAITVVLSDRRERLVVSRGPEPTLPEEDFDVLRSAVLGQPK